MSCRIKFREKTILRCQIPPRSGVKVELHTFSSSEGSSSLSKLSGSKITWQVEHAIDFSHAAAIWSNGQSILYVIDLWHPCKCLYCSEHTFDIKIIFPRQVDNIITLIAFDSLDLLAFRIHESDFDAV